VQAETQSTTTKAAASKTKVTATKSTHTPSTKPAAAKKAAPKTRMGTVKPVLDQQGVPTGWTLQLASFKERTNAVALQQRLKKLGYKAYIRNKGDLSKVFVGPDLQKKVIERLKAELKRKLKLDGLVLRFRP
jgi:DedD protein